MSVAPLSGVPFLRRTIERMVAAEGLRPLAARTGIPLGQIRSLLAGRAVRITTLEQITSALGLRLQVREAPPRDERKVPRAIAVVLEIPLEADIAAAVRKIELDELGSELRAKLMLVDDLADRAASTASSLRRLGKRPEWTATDVDAQAPGNGREEAPGLLVIPFVTGLREGGGGGHPMSGESTEAAVCVSPEALEPWARPERLLCFRAADEGMKPTIRAGDFVAVDPERRDPLDGQLFAFQTNSGLSVRRLVRKAGWLVSGADPGFETRLSERDRILGRVAWHGAGGTFTASDR